MLTNKYVNYKFHFWDQDKEFEEFTSSGVRFTRIIASHVWEHVSDPEIALLKWHSMLEDDGLLTIAIPCDPGLFLRTGQLISRRKAKSIMGISKQVYDLQMAREHKNSAQNLVKIFRYYCPNGKIKLFPLIIPIIEFNLFCIITAKKIRFS
jgi:predicted SAM-dependent methyltransferase